MKPPTSRAVALRLMAITHEMDECLDAIRKESNALMELRNALTRLTWEMLHPKRDYDKWLARLEGRR